MSYNGPPPKHSKPSASASPPPPPKGYVPPVIEAKKQEPMSGNSWLWWLLLLGCLGCGIPAGIDRDGSQRHADFVAEYPDEPSPETSNYRYAAEYLGKPIRKWNWWTGKYE